MPWRLPDNKTTVFTTDEPMMLTFDVDTLSTMGGLIHTFKDDMVDPTIGATHMVKDVNSDDTIGLLTEMPVGITGISYIATFYRIQAADVHKRVRIGSIKTEKMSYYHTFGHTDKYLLFPDFPVNFNLSRMVAGDPMESNFINDTKGKIKFHVMTIADGTTKTFEADHYGFIMHTGNTYMDGDNMVVDFEMYVEAPVQPFSSLDFDYINNPNRSGLEMGSRYRRYTINIVTGAISFVDTLSYKEDNAGFPIINPNW